MPDQSRIHRRRWVIFAVLALMYILVYFYRVSLAVVAGDISRELRLTPPAARSGFPGPPPAGS